MTPDSKPRVVIVGAGFGGLNAAQAMARAPVRVTVIDRKNHHTFQPLLYQVATAGLSPGEIAAPIRSILSSHKNVEVLLAEVTGFDLERRMVQTAEFEIPYDYLIVAAGASHAYFGHDDWQPLAPGLKTIEDALEIRRRVLLAFELAERQIVAEENAPGEETQKATAAPLNFVVVGGGPTGVELAGTLAEISRHALAHDFRAIDPKRTHIVLLEGGPRVLPTYPEDLSRSAQLQLEHLGVEVHTSTMVTKVEPGAVHYSTGNSASTKTDTRLEAAVILWAAGVAASPLGKKLGVAVDRAGRVPVQPDLSLADHPEVFVIGDLAALKDEHGKMLPGVSPVAIQQGRFVANLIRKEIKVREEMKNQKRAQIKNEGAPFKPAFGLSGDSSASPPAGVSRGGDFPPRPSFHYWDKGSLATIGRAAAVADFGKIHISGFLAWLSWLFIHIFFLIGFQNRLLVFIQWAWSYATYERGARLITGSTSLPGWTADSGAASTPENSAHHSAQQEIHASSAKQ
jgi:NADH:ubiquinone reductase (H+-translocating)